MRDKNQSPINIVNALIGINSNLKLDSLHKKNNLLINLQTEIKNNQSQLLEFQKKQLDFQQQQLYIQKQILIQQEIQTKIQQQNEIQRERQIELKKIIHALKLEASKVLATQNILARYVLLQLIIRDLNKYNISAEDFEEIRDKEYADKVISTIYGQMEQIYLSFSESELQDLELIQTFKMNLKYLKDKISLLHSSKYFSNLQKTKFQNSSHNYDILINFIPKRRNFKPQFISSFINKIFDHLKNTLLKKQDSCIQLLSYCEEQAVREESEIYELEEQLKTKEKTVEDFFSRHQELSFLRN